MAHRATHHWQLFTRNMSMVELVLLDVGLDLISWRDKSSFLFRRGNIRAHWVSRGIKRWAAQYPERVKFIFIVGKWKFYFWISISTNDQKRYSIRP